MSLLVRVRAVRGAGEPVGQEPSASSTIFTDRAEQLPWTVDRIPWPRLRASNPYGRPQRGEFPPGREISRDKTLPPYRGGSGATLSTMTPNAPLDELGEFLKQRRAAISPRTVGLPENGIRIRRVKGLRREEVAQLAAIGTDNYTRVSGAVCRRPRRSWPSWLRYSIWMTTSVTTCSNWRAGRVAAPGAEGAAAAPAGPGRPDGDTGRRHGSLNGYSRVEFARCRTGDPFLGGSRKEAELHSDSFHRPGDENSVCRLGECGAHRRCGHRHGAQRGLTAAVGVTEGAGHPPGRERGAQPLNRPVAHHASLCACEEGRVPRDEPPRRVPGLQHPLYVVGKAGGERCHQDGDVRRIPGKLHGKRIGGGPFVHLSARVSRFSGGGHARGW